MSDVEALVVCEGEDGSLDVRLVERVLEHHAVRARVMAAGDATALRTICRALKHPIELAFELKDRDFTAGTPDLAPPGSPRRLRWRRHEVENFLVEPRVVHLAFEALRVGTTVPPWMTQAPPDVAAAGALMGALATNLLPDHLGGTMWFERYARSTRNNPATFRRPGAGAVQRDGWVTSLTQEAQRIVGGCNALAADPLFDGPSIGAEWTRRLTELTASDFVTSGAYLRDMEGKALLGALHRRVQSWPGGAKVTRAGLESLLFDALVSLLGTAYEPTDFRDLAEHIRHHAAVA